MTPERKWEERADMGALLCRGRSPSAVATFGGSKEEDIQGELCFYHTPLGLLMTAQLKGLKRDGIIPYRLYLEDGDGENRFLPVLYAKEGRAWARLLTRRLDLDILQKHRLLLCEEKGCEPHVLIEARWQRQAV